MFSKMMRAVCLLLGVTHGILGVLAIRAANWRGALEDLAILLLAVLVWFAVPPGAEALERPRIGTRSVRIGLYCAVIALGCISGLSFFFGGVQAGGSGGAGSSTLLLLILALLVPLMNAERRDRSTP